MDISLFSSFYLLAIWASNIKANEIAISNPIKPKITGCKRLTKRRIIYKLLFTDY